LRECRRLVFHEIFVDHASRAELIITFLALLEMTRLRLTRLRQDGPLEPIYIELTVADEEPGAPPFVDQEAGTPAVSADASEPVASDSAAVASADADDPAAGDPAPSNPAASDPTNIQLDPPDRGDLEEYE